MKMTRKGFISSICSTSYYRWESLLDQGRRVIVVGDLNIAPFAIDRCDAEPEFEKNMFRTWLRSMLRECGGHFVDVFRSKHPFRKGAYTCFSPRIGAEEFNYGSRIDHILIAGPCLHENHISENLSLFDCHVEESDIMIQFLRGNHAGRPKWQGGRSVKLNGSDHVPVYMILNGVPDLPLHSTPPLAVRYVPEVRGWQQTIVPFLRKSHFLDAKEKLTSSEILTVDDSASEDGAEDSVASLNNSTPLKCEKASILTQYSSVLGQSNSQTIDIKKDIFTESNNPSVSFSNVEKNSFSRKIKVSAKKVKCNAYSQLTLRSYFQKSVPETDESLGIYDIEKKNDPIDGRNSLSDVEEDDCGTNNHGKSLHYQDETETCSPSFSKTENRNIALLEWRRIQQRMKMSIPLCKGHSEPCVARSVKKEGPNNGRRFYICARAQGPSDNPEANCGHFEWATKRSRHRN